MTSEPKQVILWRKDLKVHKGKIAAQCAHAAMKDLLDKIVNADQTKSPMAFDEAEKMWYFKRFKKIVLGVENEAELEIIYIKAKLAGLRVHMIVDAGLTEFNGVTTKTCVAIGPHFPEEIDPHTGHLKPF